VPFRAFSFSRVKLRLNCVVVVGLQLVGLRRGDIVVALKCTGGDGGGGSRVLDVRWDTCRRVAELVVHNHRRRRAHGSAGGGGGGVQLKIVTPIVAASDGHAIATTDPTKVTEGRSSCGSVFRCPSTIRVRTPGGLIIKQNDCLPLSRTAANGHARSVFKRAPRPVHQ